MILGLPLDSWVLIVLSVGIGVVVELVWYLGARRRAAGQGTEAPG